MNELTQPLIVFFGLLIIFQINDISNRIKEMDEKLNKDDKNDEETN